VSHTKQRIQQKTGGAVCKKQKERSKLGRAGDKGYVISVCERSYACVCVCVWLPQEGKMESIPNKYDKP